MFKNIVGRREFIQFFRKFSSQNKRVDVQKLLDESATFRDAKPTAPEDVWSTLPYPQSAVIKRPSQIDDTERTKLDPENTSLILFSGEGSQYGGMAKSLIVSPDAKDIYEEANEILG